MRKVGHVSLRRLTRRRGRLPELTHIEVVIETALSEQLVVRPPFNDAVVIDDQHQIGVTDGTQAVSDNEGSAAFKQAQQRLLNL